MAENYIARKNSKYNVDFFASIIMPTYNRSKTIGLAIESVIEQTHHNWELIILDDASTDNTDEIVEGYKKNDDRIQYVKSERNEGANTRRNQGIQRAKGEYIAFLDSDNYWEPTKLEKQMALLEEDKEASICFCKVRVIDARRETVLPNQKVDCKCLGEILKKCNIVDTSTLLIKKSVLDEAGSFDEAMPRLQDYELIFRLVNEFKYKVAYIDEILVTNIIQNNSISRNSKLLTEAIKLFIDKHKDCFTTEELADWICNRLNTISLDDEVGRREILEHIASDKELLLNVAYNMSKQFVRKNEYAAFLYEWLITDWSNIFVRFKDKNIALYGVGRLGKLLMKEFDRNNIQINTLIDRNATSYEGINIIRPDEFRKEVEIIIVAVFYEGDIIKNQLKAMYNCEIFTLKELLEQNR